MTNFIIDFDGTKILAKDEIQAINLFNALISARVVEYNYNHTDPKYTIKKEWILNVVRIEPAQVIDSAVKTYPYGHPQDGEPITTPAPDFSDLPPL